MFFGYAFGPVVGFFSGAVGNIFGDALTGFGLSPQWSIANGLIGFIAGLPMLFADKKKSLDFVLINAVLAALAVVVYLFNRSEINQLYYSDTPQPTSLLAGLSIVIGFILVLIVRFAFGKNIDLATAVTWAMLANILGIAFAALSDIWINGYSPATAIVGEFLPAAGPNLIFAAILVPLLVVAYVAVDKVSAFNCLERETGFSPPNDRGKSVIPFTQGNGFNRAGITICCDIGRDIGFDTHWRNLATGIGAGDLRLNPKYAATPLPAREGIHKLGSE